MIHAYCFVPLIHADFHTHTQASHLNIKLLPETNLNSAQISEWSSDSGDAPSQLSQIHLHEKLHSHWRQNIWHCGQRKKKLFACWRCHRYLTLLHALVSVVISLMEPLHLSRQTTAGGEQCSAQWAPQSHHDSLLSNRPVATLKLFSTWPHQHHRLLGQY